MPESKYSICRLSVSVRGLEQKLIELEFSTDSYLQIMVWYFYESSPRRLVCVAATTQTNALGI